MTAVHPTAVVAPGAELGADVEVGAYSIVGPRVRIGDGARILPHVFLDGWTTLGAGCTVFPFASLGSQTQDLKFKGGRTFVEIGERTTIREYVTVNSGTEEGEVTKVGAGCLLMAYSHVAHKCRVGDGVIIANGGTLAGHVAVEDHARIGGLTAVHQFVRIGRLSIVGGMSRIVQDVPPFMLAEGNPAAVHGPNAVGLERAGVSPEARAKIKAAYKILYRQGLSTSQALEKIGGEIEACPEIEHLAAFIRASERGIIK